MKKFISALALSMGLVACGRAYKQSGMSDDMLLKSMAIYEGIDINGISMAGVNILAAEEKLMEKHEKNLDKKVKLTYQEEEFNPSYRDLGYYYDYDKVIEEAYGLARTGEAEERLAEIQRIKDEKVSLKLDLSRDQAKAREYLEAIAEGVTIPAKGGDLVYDSETDSLKAGPGEPGTTINIDDAIAKTEGLDPEANNSFELLSQESLIDPEMEALAESIDGPIGSSESYFYAWFWERVENIRVSTGELNGLVIMPGETFSFNDYIGNTPLERGYQVSIVIQGTEEVPGLGGGVCQTSTALYHAALEAGLEIVERHPHTLIMPYSPGGLDAAVEYGLIDLKIRNPYDFPVLVKTYYAEGEIGFEIWGDTSKMKDEYIMYSNWNYDIPYSSEKIFNPDLAEGEEIIKEYGVVGSGWSAYRENTVTGEVEYLGDTVYPAVRELIEAGS